MAVEYKDFTSDHAMSLLAMREDIGKGDAYKVSCERHVVMLYKYYYEFIHRLLVYTYSNYYIVILLTVFNSLKNRNTRTKKVPLYTLAKRWLVSK